MTIVALVGLIKARNERRLELIREALDADLVDLESAFGNPDAIAALEARWSTETTAAAKAADDPALRETLEIWQKAAEHHARDYHPLAVDIEPFVIMAGLKVKRRRKIQTWLETPSGREIRVTYKRLHIDNRIELEVDGGPPHYFGPGDQAAIEAFVRPLL
jgi:hypothetical protein